MKVKELLKLKPEAFTIHAGKSMADAMRLMIDKNISSLVIVDDDHKPVSIITERDIFHLAYRFRGDMMDIKVDGAGATKLHVGSVDDEIKDIARIMIDNKVRHLPIMDNGNNLFGIVTIRDIAAALLE